MRPKLAVDALQRQEARQAEERVTAGERWHGLGLVFTSTIGTLWSRAT